MVDFIVVGSGCTGAMAAQTLVEAGRSVHMLDVGLMNTSQLDIPDKDFITLRKTDSEQYRYFIGQNGEFIRWDNVGKVAQLTPPRQHMISQVKELLPTNSEDFSAVESLGYGGLGIGWGVGCWEWSKRELEAAGLNPAKMYSAYDLVSQRIGISGAKDDAAAYTLNKLSHFQKAPDMDRNHKYLYARYKKKQAKLKQRGFVMGRAPLALLTEDKDDRQKYAYKEMDFYSDQEQSAYRPWMTVNNLRKQSSFTYSANQFVTSFDSKSDHIVVNALDTTNQKMTQYKARKLVLAAGVFGSARIVLRSLNAEAKLPLLCNPYAYIPCLMPRLVGQEAERHKLGFAQLSMFLDEDGSNFGAAMASIYSYQSLLLFRMIRRVPFNFYDSRLLLRYLLSGLVIMGVHHPDRPSSNKSLSMVKDAASPTGDSLRIAYSLSNTEKTKNHSRQKQFMRAMRSLGAYPLSVINPGFGSSIHYAGCLPFSTKQTPFSLTPSGRLNGTKNVFVADGSGFKYLPAKGLTFSLMANAHIAASEALKNG